MAKKRDDLADYAADTELQSAEPLNLTQLAVHARALVNVDMEIDDLEKQLEAKVAERTKLTETDIPTVMSLLALPRFDIPGSNGAWIEVNEKVYASFPNSEEFPDRARDGRNWLIKYGHGSIVKQSVTIAFDATDTAQVEEVITRLMVENPARVVTRKISVHSGSLRKLIKDLRRDGQQPPLDKLGGHIKTVAELKRPREKKG